MKALSPIVFAIAGLVFGLLAGMIIGYTIGCAMIKTGSGGTGLDNTALVIVLVLCGAVIGSVAGFVAGVVIPRSVKAKSRGPEEISAFDAGEHIWPPPPSQSPWP